MQKFKHPVIQNSLSFYLINFSDYLISLILLPFLARTINIEGIGILGLATSLGIVCTLIIEYGFSLSATREIAANKKTNNFTFSKVLLSKIVLVLPCIIVCLVSFFIVPIFQKYSFVVFFVFSSSILNGFTPLWYFQGTQRVLPFAILKILLRTITIIPVFFLVKSVDEIWIVFISQIISSLIICLISMFWVIKEVKIINVTKNEIVNSLKESWHPFSLTIVPPICTMVIFFWLSTKLSIESIGLINSAERIFRALISIFGPLGQAIYPFLISQLSMNKSKALIQTKKVLYFYFTLGMLILFSVILFSDIFIIFYLGENFIKSSLVLKIFALSIPIIKISHVLGRQWLFSLKLDKIANFGVLVSSIILSISTFLSFHIYEMLSFPISLFISELFLLFYYFIYLNHKKIGFWNQNVEKRI